jgi:hypothetical protein
MRQSSSGDEAEEPSCNKPLSNDATRFHCWWKRTAVHKKKVGPMLRMAEIVVTILSSTTISANALSLM